MRATVSQTVGPFFKDGLFMQHGARLFDRMGDDAIRIDGRLLDGEGQPVADGLIEVWQCDPAGRFAEVSRGDSGISGGFGRIYTDARGEYSFTTLMPGVPPGGGAPYLAVMVFARGLLRHLHTRIYFEGNPANDSDPTLSSTPGERRLSLIARRTGQNGAYAFDIRLTGAGETVFFAY